MSDNSDDALPPEPEEEVTEETPTGQVQQRVGIAPFNSLQPPTQQMGFVTVPLTPTQDLYQQEQELFHQQQQWERQRNRWDSEPIQRLRAIRDRVAMARLGGLEITKPKYISASAVGVLARWLVAQCISDGIAMSEEGLYVRDLIPYHDLLAGSDGGAIQHEDEWITPDPRRFVGGYDTTEEFSIYITNRMSDNDRKVIMIYGIHNLDDSAPIHLKRLEFMRGTVKRITLTKIDSLFALDNFYFFQTPILYKKNDSMNIRGIVGRDGIGHTDKIKILGMVGEPIGMNYNG